MLLVSTYQDFSCILSTHSISVRQLVNYSDASLSPATCIRVRAFPASDWTHRELGWSESLLNKNEIAHGFW